MKHIVVINGNPKSGKDEFIKQVSQYAKTINISSVDPIKDVAKLLGWDGNKQDKSRRFLSELKGLSTWFNDYPYSYIKEKIEEFKSSDNEILFIHIREPKEIERVVEDFKASTLVIINPKAPRVDTNTSDSNVWDYNYNYSIRNDDTIEDLNKKAARFVEHLKRL